VRPGPRKKVPRAGGGPGPKGPPPAIDDAQATTRGFIVIGVTVLIGLIIFFRGVSQTSDPAQVVSGPTTTLAPLTSIDRNQAPTTTEPSQGTTIPKAVTTKVAPKDTKIVVANGVDPAKVIAGPIADKLTTASYTVTGKVDLTAKASASNVFYTEGLQGEAQGVQKALGWPDTVVAPMPKTPPTPLNGAQILVVVGTDRG
jgi:hypothetical protein